jgi:hypothetical protein
VNFYGQTFKNGFRTIAALGYTPQRATPGLNERRTRTVGVVVPDITTGLFTNIVRRIEQQPPVPITRSFWRTPKKTFPPRANGSARSSNVRLTG